MQGIYVLLGENSFVYSMHLLIHTTVLIIHSEIGCYYVMKEVY